jgi:hypothetical protein
MVSVLVHGEVNIFNVSVYLLGYSIYEMLQRCACARLLLPISHKRELIRKQNTHLAANSTEPDKL